jgi:RHS repeat-associated protein
MVDGTGTTSYTYNTAKQLTRVTDGAGDSVGYGYDALGRISSITYPDGHQVTRGYDGDSRLASVTDANGHTTSFGYDGDSNLVSTTFGNGVVEATTVDDSDETTGIDITNAAGTGLATFGYTYTPGGQVATANDSLAPTTNNTYSYTPDRQLVGQDGDPTAYGYDGVGNITALDTGDALSYDPAGRLVTDQPAAGATVAAYGYDADGNRTSETTGTATTSYVYDQANRLTVYTGPGASAGMGIGYDGDGLRASSGGDFVGSHDYTWDSASSDLPLLLSDGTNDYLYGPSDQVVEQINQTDGTTTYLQHDQIGSVRLLTDTTGAIVGTRSYDPYGTLLAHDGDQTTPFGYTGQYTDPTGLIYLRARYYDPTDSQFLTVDPMVDQTRAWYTYAAGDPLDNSDPTGLHLCYDNDVNSACDGYAGSPSPPPPPPATTDTSDPSPMPHPGDPSLPEGPTLPCGIDSGAGDLDNMLAQLNSLYAGSASGADGARQSVSDAGRLLRRSPDPQVRSAAGKVLAKLGGPTRDLVNNPVLKHAAKASVVVAFLLDIAEFSQEYNSPVEVVSRAALATASGFVGAVIGGAAAGLLCPLLGVPDAGVATVICEGVLAGAGAIGGEKVGVKLSDLIAKVVWNHDGMPAVEGNVLLVFPKAEPGPSPSPPEERQ